MARYGLNLPAPTNNTAASNQLLISSQDRLQQALGGINKTVEDAQAGIVKNNTNALIADIQSKLTPEQALDPEYQKQVIALVGQFAPDQVDRAGVMNALTQQATDVVATQKQRADQASQPFRQAFDIARIKGDKVGMQQAAAGYQNIPGADLTALANTTVTDRNTAFNQSIAKGNLGVNQTQARTGQFNANTQARAQRETAAQNDFTNNITVQDFNAKNRPAEGIADDGTLITTGGIQLDKNGYPKVIGEGEVAKLPPTINLSASVPKDSIGALAQQTYGRTRQRETSGGQDTGKNPNSTASGGAQMIDTTWIETLGRISPESLGGLTPQQMQQKYKANPNDPTVQKVLALKNDSDLSAKGMQDYLEVGGQRMFAAGTPVNAVTMDGAYFLGAGGMTATYKAYAENPNKAFKDVAPDALKSNPWLGKNPTVGQVMSTIARKSGTSLADMNQADASSLVTGLSAVKPAKQHFNSVADIPDSLGNISTIPSLADTRLARAENTKIEREARSTHVANQLKDFVQNGGAATPSEYISKTRAASGADDLTLDVLTKSIREDGIPQAGSKKLLPISKVSPALQAIAAKKTYDEFQNENSWVSTTFTSSSTIAERFRQNLANLINTDNESLQADIYGKQAGTEATLSGKGVSGKTLATALGRNVK